MNEPPNRPGELTITKTVHVRAVVTTSLMCLHDLRASTMEASRRMAKTAKEIDAAIIKLKLDGFEYLALNWVNKLDRSENPDGSVGYFEIVGTKDEQP